MDNKIYDTNIEASILSSLLFEPAQVKRYISKLDEKLFYYSVYKKIYQTIIYQYENGKLIDEEIIRNKLGVEYEEDLLYVMSKNPISTLDDYLDVLQDYALKREMQTLAFEIGKSLENSATGLEIHAKVENFTDSLSKKSSLEIFEINNIKDIEDKEVDFICTSWLPIPVRTVSLVTAPGGTGKSWFVMQLAMRAIQEGKVKKAFLWLSEDPKEISKNRFNKIFDKVLKSENESIKEGIDISDSPTIQILYEEQRRVAVSALFTHFKAKLDKYDLIILDPLIAFYGTDENNNAHARKFMQLFTDWANKENKTIIFIHHSTKNTTQSRGASAFVDAVRSVYEIDHIKDSEGKTKETNKRIIKLTKDNYGISNLIDGFQVERELFPPKVVHEQIFQMADTLALGMPNDF